VDLPVATDGVEVARPVDREGGEVVDVAGVGNDLVRALGEIHRLPVLDAETPHLPGDEVGEEVDPLHARRLAPVDVAAGNGAAAAVMRVDMHGIDERGIAGVGIAGDGVVEDRVAFLHLPAVVLAARAAARLPVHLLERTLPDVGDVEIAGQGIEARPPGVAQPEGPDLVGPRPAREGIVVGDGVVASRIAGKVVAVDIDPEDLPEQGVAVLGAVVGIAATAAVAARYVEVAVVRPEPQPATIVVREGLVVGEDQQLARRVEDVGIAGRDGVAADFRVARGVGEIDEDVTVGLEVGMEGEPEQPLFAAGRDIAIRQVEKRRGVHRSAGKVEDPDRPGVLLDHEEPVGIAGRRGGKQRQG